MSDQTTKQTSQPDVRCKPVYVLIQDKIRDGIADGTLGCGDKLPSETELAAEFQTTRSTVRHALSQLVFEGLITRHVGRGSFVAKFDVVRSSIDTRQCLIFEEQVALSGQIVTYRAPSLELVPVPHQAAEQLKIDPHSEVFRLERLRVIDQRPICVEIRYLPQEVGYRVTGEMLAERPARDFVGEILGKALPTIVVSITAEIAASRIAQLLELSESAALIVRENTHYDSDGNAVMYGRSIFPGNVRTEYVLGQKLGEHQEGVDYNLVGD